MGSCGLDVLRSSRGFLWEGGLGEGVGKGFDKGGGRMVREEWIVAAKGSRTEGRREWVRRLSLEECCSGEVPTS